MHSHQTASSFKPSPYNRSPGIKAMPDGRTRACIIEQLERCTLCADDLASELGISFSVIAHHLQQLHSDRLIHVAEYRHPPKGPARKYFRAGDRPDAVRPLPASERRILDCIRSGIVRKKDLVPASGYQPNAITTIVMALRSKGLIVYSSSDKSWRENQRQEPDRESLALLYELCM